MSTTTTYVPCISSKKEYDAAQERAVELVRTRNKTENQRKELHALKVLIKDWETENFPPLPDFDPVDYILFIMEQKGLRHTDMIPYFGASSRVSEVLNRKKPLTLKMIRTLNEYLEIPLQILVREVRTKATNHSDLSPLASISNLLLGKTTMKQTPKCLITKIDLPPETIDEHTIPQSIGGRIRSKIVICSEVNNKLSHFCDDKLAKTFHIYMNLLSHKLPSNSIPPPLIDTYDDPFLGKKVSVKLEGTSPSLNKDINPKYENGIRQKELNNILPGQNIEELKNSPNSEIDLLDLSVFNMELNHNPYVELALLRAGIFSFDHYFQLENYENIIRSQSIENTINVLKYFIDHESILRKNICRIFFGFDFSLRPEIDTLLKTNNLAPCEYSHILILRTNADTRLIHLIFYAFSREPYVFLIGENWEGLTNTFIIENPIIKGKSSYLKKLEHHTPLCFINKHYYESKESFDSSVNLELFKERRKIITEMITESMRDGREERKHINYEMEIKGLSLSQFDVAIKERMSRLCYGFSECNMNLLHKMIEDLDFKHDDPEEEFDRKYNKLIDFYLEKAT